MAKIIRNISREAAPVASKTRPVPPEISMRCMDCEHHLVIPDRDPFDSFCDDDKAIVCTLEKNPRQDLKSAHQADHSPHRIISVAVRPYNLRKEDETPGWCPLIIDATS